MCLSVQSLFLSFVITRSTFRKLVYLCLRGGDGAGRGGGGLKLCEVIYINIKMFNNSIFITIIIFITLKNTVRAK